MSKLTCREVRDDDEPRPSPGDENYESLWGGIDPPPSWREYIEDFDPDFRPYLKAAREWLLAREGPTPTAAEWANDHYLRFPDGQVLSFTWRGWGDFAQSVADKREGYMAYY